MRSWWVCSRMLFPVFWANSISTFFVRCFCSCAGAAFLALVASSWIDAAAYQPVIIGTLMIFVPGVAITNAIRDFLSGSMLSGICRMMEAFLIAVALAAGVVLKLWSVIGGVFG